MNLDEFAFFNQQLAAMLRDGIPLEGALRQLCTGLRRGALRTELTALEADLAQGTPLADALARRQLLPLYQRLLVIGARSNDLPASLTLLADYFQRQHALWARLKGLMVYPALVMIAAFALSLLLSLLTTWFVVPVWSDFLSSLWEDAQLPAATRLAIPLMTHSWIFPAMFAVPLLAMIGLAFAPGLRQRLLDRLPAFREARLAQTALASNLLLKGGVPFPEAVGVLEELQPPNRLRADLTAWRRNLTEGVSRFSAIAAGGRFFPPLFVWLVDSAREDLAAGFQQAAEIYEARAAHRAEILLYAALPVAVLGVGILVLLQAYLIGSMYLVFMQMLGGLGEW